MKVIIEILAEPAELQHVTLKREILPYVVPYSEYHWLRQKFMDLTKRAKEDVLHKIRKADGYYYIEKITVLE